MWIGHFRLKHANCIHLTHCDRFGVADYVYPLNTYVDKGKMFFTNLNILEGNKEEDDMHWE